MQWCSREGKYDVITGIETKLLPLSLLRLSGDTIYGAELLAMILTILDMRIIPRAQTELATFKW